MVFWPWTIKIENRPLGLLLMILPQSKDFADGKKLLKTCSTQSKTLMALYFIQRTDQWWPSGSSFQKRLSHWQRNTWSYKETKKEWQVGELQWQQWVWWMSFTSRINAHTNMTMLCSVVNNIKDTSVTQSCEAAQLHDNSYKRQKNKWWQQ